MRGQRGIRTIPGKLLLAIALGALALFAIPAVGSAHNGHHHGHSDPAGTIKSFDPTTGLLTVDLTEGGDISGLVVDRTRIRCDENREDHRRGRHDRRHGDHATTSDSGPGRDGSGGDNSGPGNSGDDRGEHAEEPGEDNHNQGNEPGGDNHGEPGDDDNDPGRGAGRNDRCVAQLVEGAIVARAELDLEDGNAFFEKIVVMPAAQEEAPATPPAG